MNLRGAAERIDPLILDQNRVKVSANIGFVFSFKPESLQG